MTRYPSPAEMRYPEGDARFAYVTLLMFNDTYLPGVLTLAHALRQQQTQADLVCLVTEQITEEARVALYQLYDHVISVETVFVPYARRQARQYIPYVFTRIHALRLGLDGDLGYRYEKLVALDADVLPLRDYDHLFTLPAPAGILNERKEHFLDYDEEGKYVVPPSVDEDGTWQWHRIYNPICPHGQPIPQAITDRVRHDPTNMGINTCVLTFAPSLAEYHAIRADLARPDILELVGDRFEWPDMQYLTMRWSGTWTNIDLRFCGFSGYPNLDVLHGTHYAGFKPWAFKKEKAMRRYGRFPDFRRWFDEYQQMMRAHPRLAHVPRLKRLADAIRRLDPA